MGRAYGRPARSAAGGRGCPSIDGTLSNVGGSDGEKSGIDAAYALVGVCLSRSPAIYDFDI